MRDIVENTVLDSIFGRDKIVELVKWLIGRQMALLGDPPLNIVLWNGRKIYSAGGNAVATVIIRNRNPLLKLLVNPELHFGDAYSEGDIDIEGDLVEFFEYVFRSKSKASKKNVINKYLLNIINNPLSNSLDESRKNIHHHYDIGNEFYRIWLDEKMQYTCAYFSEPSATLEEAQIAKMNHVCKKLRLQPGNTVVEAGCGWGMLALHMARHYGVTVTSYNISHEQILFARERAKREGLDDRVEYIEDDYRNISGRFDAFVSVGMLEHVGPNNYREFGRLIRRSLKEGGMGLIHTIGRNMAGYMNPWTQRRIFPGAYTPVLREMMEIFEPFGFSVLDVENLRLHYAKTLGCWLERYERAHEQIGEMFDQKFMRSWRFYLAGSIASFTSGELQLFQVVFTNSSNNDLPWSRAHLYTDSSH
jgi:cyclopropane-fatty-acyl-phospholipid synthase